VHGFGKAWPFKGKEPVVPNAEENLHVGV